MASLRDEVAEAEEHARAVEAKSADEAAVKANALKHLQAAEDHVGLLLNESRNKLEAMARENEKIAAAAETTGAGDAGASFGRAQGKSIHFTRTTARVLPPPQPSLVSSSSSSPVSSLSPPPHSHSVLVHYHHCLSVCLSDCKKETTRVCAPRQSRGPISYITSSDTHECDARGGLFGVGGGLTDEERQELDLLRGEVQEFIKTQSEMDDEADEREGELKRAYEHIKQLQAQLGVTA